MSGPSVVVDRAPDGWTHIGGPGMHLLIGLDEDDERTIAASDAADGGDIDDVVEVLTAGGMRKAHHFVGVHWQPRTRIVAFGPVSALVTLADGTEHDVRATSSKVWTDLELPDHPDRVVLRVLEESERAQPVPAQGLTAGPPSPGATSPASPGGGSAQLTAPDEPADATPDKPAEATPDAATTPDTSTSVTAASPDTATSPQTAPSIAVADPPLASDRPDAAGEPEPAPDRSAPADGIPTFAATAAIGGTSTDEQGAQDGRGRSTWERSWAQGSTVPTASESNTSSTESTSAAATSGDVSAKESVAHADSVERDDPFRPAADVTPEPPVASVPALRSWTSVAPAVPVRATPTSDVVGDEESSASAAAPTIPAPTPAAPVVATDPAPSAPVADDLPVVVAARDVDSTWAARPVLDPDAGSTTSAAPSAPVGGPLRPSVPAPATAGIEDAGLVDDDQPAAPPSYDYLFGHTTAADEHRKVLASLTRSDDDETGPDEDDHRADPPVVDATVPPVADASDAPVTNAAPAPEVPARPIPSAPVVPEGGLISSVPWASPAPAEEVPEPGPEPEVPTFSGRHTPPPAPSLLPPMNTPPPGVRAPEATPLISTGPPPASTGPAPALSTPPPAPPTPSAATPTAPAATAYPGAAQPPAEPTFDVPISIPVAVPPVPPVAPVAPATEPNADSPVPTVDAGAGTDDDETELTVDRSALLEARHAAQNQTFSGPSVLAVLCSAGHPTPPHSDRCRICGSSIPPQEPFTMPRPPLGVLRLSTGDVVTLDRSVLLGRAPKLGDGLAVHDRPHVVKVPSPERDVSRNHVEVILEGWHVLIRDLGTTNGTTVTLPGESPLRLRANDQQVLEPGSLVSMADEVSFTFEAAS